MERNHGFEKPTWFHEEPTEPTHASFQKFKESLERRAAEHAETSPNRRLALQNKEKLVARVHELEKELDYVKHHDELTGLLNRTGFAKLVGKYQEEGVSGTILMLDLDNFKRINTLGDQLVGDSALIAVAIELMRMFRIETDEIARETSAEPETGAGRAGGEEFLIFLPGASPEQIHAKFKKFDDLRQQELAKIEIKFDFFNPKIPENLLTFSGGLTKLAPDEELEEAVVRANRAMRIAKDSGKNHLEIAVEDLPANKDIKTAE